jgi:very-short-patch-repair endonuclease
MSVSDQVSMFYNASPKVFERANELRKNMTEAESKLWEHLREKRILNLRFRAQHPLDNFIADFYCHPLKLVIEIDGETPKSKEHREYDIIEEADLSRWKIKIIRLKNEDIENNIEQVIEEIKKVCALRSLELESLP